MTLVTRTFVIIHRVASITTAAFDRVDTQRFDTNVFIKAFSMISLQRKSIRNGGWKETGEC